MVKMQKKKVGGVRWGWDGQGGCERRIEVTVKMKKSQGKVSVDVKLPVIVKMRKKLGEVRSEVWGWRSGRM